MSRKPPTIPHLNYPLIETHCHLDYLKTPVDQVLARAAEVGIERVITIAVSPSNLDTVLAISAQHPQVWCTQGVHPHQANEYDATVEQRLRQSFSHDQVVAVGETGLDYYYDHSDRRSQRHAFVRQLTLAVEYALPVVIHTRDADADTRAVLADFVNDLPRKGVIHSFTAGPELAEFALEAGFYLGFNGICTFNKAENVRDSVRLTPMERLLLETDAPYLTPAPYRGRENAPFYLPFIAEKIAETKAVTIDTVLSHAYRNSQQLFFRQPFERPNDE